MLAKAKVRGNLRSGLKTLPEGVEASVRQGRGRRILFLVNHTEEVRRVAAPRGKDALTGRPVAGAVDLGPYGVKVVRIK